MKGSCVLPKVFPDVSRGGHRVEAGSDMQSHQRGFIRLKDVTNVNWPLDADVVRLIPNSSLRHDLYQRCVDDCLQSAVYCDSGLLAVTVEFSEVSRLNDGTGEICS